MPSFKGDIFTRRASVIAVASAVAASALARRPASRAGKKRKKPRDPSRTCKRQVERCQPIIDARCAELFDEPEAIAQCRDLFGPCCDFFKTCDALAALNCMIFPDPVADASGDIVPLVG
jgi:hypothetical protein